MSDGQIGSMKPVVRLTQSPVSYEIPAAAGIDTATDFADDSGRRVSAVTQNRLNALCFREFATVFLVVALVTVLLGLADADMNLARFCHSASGWRGQDWSLGKTLYEFGKTWRQPALFLGLGGLVFALASPRFTALRKYRRAAIFLPLFLATGPGLIVNACLKDHWARPRPCQIHEFGGVFTFQQPWQPGDPHESIPGTKKPSFPSGHAAMGFFMIAPWFILRAKKRRWAALWLAGGLAFGALIGAARISQGGHFLSDILWSGTVVYLTGLVLSRLLQLDEEPRESPAIRAGHTNPGRRSHAGVFVAAMRRAAGL